MPKLHVVCHLPAGMNRGGRHNQKHAEHDIGDHTPEQLRDLLACPHHTVVIGEALTEAYIAEIEARADKAKPAADKTKKEG